MIGSSFSLSPPQADAGSGKTKHIEMALQQIPKFFARVCQDPYVV